MFQKSEAAAVLIESKRIFSNITSLIMLLVSLFFLTFLACVNEENVEPKGSQQESTAQLQTIFSGRTIDESGNSVAGGFISIRRLRYSESGSRTTPPVLTEQTDAEGRFTFNNIYQGSLALSVSIEPENETNTRRKDRTKILSMDIEGMRLYPTDNDDFYFHRRMGFVIQAGDNITDTVITVRPEIKIEKLIRARVVFADGSPLINANLHSFLKQRDFSGNDELVSVSEQKTDANGYFQYNLGYNDEHLFHIFAVKYHNLVAKAAPFMFKTDEHETDLVMTLNGNPISLSENSENKIIGYSWGGAASNHEAHALLDPPPIWIVNPANNHAYKWVHCDSVEEAMGKASKEEAYLVAINDAAEYNWLRTVFWQGPFWIGLSDVEKEGQWQWHSGEPLTYTNWSASHKHNNTDERDYVVVGMFGKWQAVDIIRGRGSMRRATRTAILEKQDFPIKTQVEVND